MDRTSPLFLTPLGTSDPSSLLGGGNGHVLLLNGVGHEDPAGLPGDQFSQMQRALDAVVHGTASPTDLQRQLAGVFHSVAARPLTDFIPQDSSSNHVSRTADAVRFLREHPSQDLRLMTCLRLDTESFTRKTDGISPRAIRAYKEQLARVVLQICEAHGGVYQEDTGDGHQILWGVVQTDPDDAFHAVNAALEILDWSKKFNADREARGEVSFRVRIGVDTGLGTPEYRETAGLTSIKVAGPLMARTQRTEDSIKEGDESKGEATADVVCATISTLHFCGDRFVTKARGYIAGKNGRARETREDVPIFEVRYLRPTAGSQDSLEQAEGIFVNRSEEMENLQQAARSCFESCEARVVLVTGDQGVGKTRVLREFDRHADDFERALAPMFGQGVNLPTAAVNRDIVSVLRNFLKIEGLEPAEAFHVLRRDLTIVFAALADKEREERIQLIACFLGMVIPEKFRTERIAGLMGDPRKLEQLREESLEAVKEYFDALVRVRPVVMILDDLQWFDRGSLRVLEILKRHLAHRAFFVLGAVRADAVDALGWGNDFATQQPLKALPDEELAKILSDIYPVEVEDEKLRTCLVREAKGSAYQLHELVRAVRDFNWHLTADNHLIAPDEQTTWGGNSTFLAARLDQLNQKNPDAYAVLGYASIINGDFSLRDLDRLGAPVTHKNIEELVKLELIVPTTQGHYRFSTDMLREAMYARLSSNDLNDIPRETREKHRRYLEILRDPRERKETDPAILAYHLERSGELEEAADLYYQAAETAYFKKAVIEIADQLYAHAYRAASALGDRKREWRILRGWDEALLQAGHFTEQEKVFELSKPVAATLTPVDMAGALFRVGRARTFGDKYESGSEALQEALRLSLEIPPTSDLISDARKIAGSAFVILGYNYSQCTLLTKAHQIYKSAISFAQLTSNRPLEARICLGLSGLYAGTGEYSEGLVVTKKAVEIYQELPNEERRILVAMAGVGANLIRLGHYVEAEEILKKAAKISQEKFNGKGHNSEYIFLKLARAVHLQGRPEEAIAILEEYRKVNPKHPALDDHLAYLALSYLNNFQITKAQEEAQKLWTLSQSTDNNVGRVLAQMILAQCYFKVGGKENSEQAYQAIETARKIYDEALHGVLADFDIELLLTQAEILYARGHVGESRRVIEQAEKIIDQRVLLLSVDHRNNFLNNVDVNLRVKNFGTLFANGTVRILNNMEKAFLAKATGSMHVPRQSLPTELAFIDLNRPKDVQKSPYSTVQFNDIVGDVLPLKPGEVLRRLFLCKAHGDYIPSDLLGEEGVVIGAASTITLGLDESGQLRSDIDFSLHHRNVQVTPDGELIVGEESPLVRERLEQFFYNVVLKRGSFYKDYEVHMVGETRIMDGVVSFVMTPNLERSKRETPVSRKPWGTPKKRKGILGHDDFGSVGIFMAPTLDGRTLLSLGTERTTYTARRGIHELFRVIRRALLESVVESQLSDLGKALAS